LFFIYSFTFLAPYFNAEDKNRIGKEEAMVYFKDSNTYLWRDKPQLGELDLGFNENLKCLTS
jgi:hypothetical protein